MPRASSARDARLRPRQRRPDAGDGAPRRDRARHGPQARRQRSSTSRDGAPASRLLKRAVVSGITSTGVHVADLHVMPAAVNRHFLKSEGLGAGVHVRPSTPDPEVMQIQFFEPPGIQATPELLEGDREALPAAGVPPSRVRRGRHRSPRPTRAAETYADDLLADARRRGDQGARLPDRRRLRALGGLDHPPGRARPARRRDDRRASVRRRAGRRVDRRRRARRSDRRSASSRRSAPTSASSSTGRASGSTSSTSRRTRSRSSRSSSSSSACSPRTGRAGRSRSRSPSRASPSRSSRDRSSR